MALFEYPEASEKVRANVLLEEGVILALSHSVDVAVWSWEREENLLGNPLRLLHCMHRY